MMVETTIKDYTEFHYLKERSKNHGNYEKGAI